MTTSRHFPTFHAILRACAGPRGRALVRAFTSPHRLWFWTTTFPVLLAPVLLYLVMRPGVEFKRSVKVGSVHAGITRSDHKNLGREAMTIIEWPAGSAMAYCWVPDPEPRPMYWSPTGHFWGPFSWYWWPGNKQIWGPFSWYWRPGNKQIIFHVRWFELEARLNH